MLGNIRRNNLRVGILKANGLIRVDSTNIVINDVTVREKIALMWRIGDAMIIRANTTLYDDGNGMHQYFNLFVVREQCSWVGEDDA